MTREEDGVTVDNAELNTSAGGSDEKIVVVGINRKRVDIVVGCL